MLFIYSYHTQCIFRYYSLLLCIYYAFAILCTYIRLLLVCYTPYILVQTLPLPSTFPSSSQQHWNPAVREALSAVTLVTESYTRPKVHLTRIVYSTYGYKVCVCAECIKYSPISIHTYTLRILMHACIYVFIFMVYSYTCHMHNINRVAVAMTAGSNFRTAATGVYSSVS